MRLPHQVQRQADRAEQLIDQFVKGQAGQGTPADQGAPNGAPPGQDGKTNGQGTNPPEVAAPAAAPAEPKTDWKAKYHTLQGMFNAEVPRLNNDLRAARARIEELEGKLAAPGNSNGKDASGAASSATPATGRKTVPDAVRDALGEDVANALQAMFDSNNSDLRAEIGSKTEVAEKAAREVKETQVADARNKFLSDLEQVVPDWKEIDEDEGWQAHLAAHDPVYDVPRQELLVRLANKGNVQAVAAMFNAWKAQSAPPAAAPAPAPAATPKPSLASQVVPAASSAAASRTPDKRMWTRQEIAKTYADAAVGRIPADKFAQIEQDILAAGPEGRIR